ncbi:MAG: hypothetical protein NC337_01810 [Roseburia sp.]|nr:hypothetical protein [Roseburia sp.]
MELHVNSPAWFTDRYGVDDEVYGFCQKAYLFFRDREYSEILHTIGIMPVVAPQEIYDTGDWRERTRFLDNRSFADIFIRMDFESWYNADSMERVEQTKEMILTAVKRVKTKGKFDYDKFAEDFAMMAETI